MAVPLRERAGVADRPGRRSFDCPHGRRLHARGRARPAGLPQRGPRVERIARLRVQLELHRRRTDASERGRRRRARRHAERRGRHHRDLRAERLRRLPVVLPGLPDDGQRKDVGRRWNPDSLDGDPHHDLRCQERSKSHLRLGDAGVRLDPVRHRSSSRETGETPGRSIRFRSSIPTRNSPSTSGRSIPRTRTGSTSGRTAS